MLTFWDLVDCSLLGFFVLHYLLEFAQFMSIELVIISNQIILCHPLLLLPSMFPNNIKKLWSDHQISKENFENENVCLCLNNNNKNRHSSQPRVWKTFYWSSFGLANKNDFHWISNLFFFFPFLPHKLHLCGYKVYALC